MDSGDTPENEVFQQDRDPPRRGDGAPVIRYWAL
jgi:hypothetical protein